MAEINEYAQQHIDKIKELCKRIKPLVVIHCITYNHEPYIRDALDGFVMQKTDFPFVAIVHEDASTDKTAEVVKEYAEKYPEIIFPICEKENQYSNPHGKLARIMNMACEATGAKYIAMCEGDDYWIDPLKLQKQVDFLESHPDYSMCFHEAMVINETSNDFKYPTLEDREYTAVEVFRTWCVPTASIVMTKNALRMPRNKDFISGDIVLILNTLKSGKIYGSSKQMSAYRVQYNGLTLSRPLNPTKHYQKEIRHYKAIYKYFPRISKKEYYRKISNSYINLGVNELKKQNIIGLVSIGKGFFYSPMVFFQRINNFLKAWTANTIILL